MPTKAEVERAKDAEIIGLLDRVDSIPQSRLGRAVREHLDEMPAWKEWLGPEPTNQQIASKVGRRLSSLAGLGKIYLNAAGGYRRGVYMSRKRAQLLRIE